MISRLAALVVTILVATASAAPKPRDVEGDIHVAAGSAPGSLEVRLTYNDLADPKPPAKVQVALVGYRADDTVTTATKLTDATGTARFERLDHSGAVAYYVLASLPRNQASDRLMSLPIVLDNTAGVTITLSADDRSAKTPPIEDLSTAQAPLPATPKDKVRVEIRGITEAAMQASLVDAATGKTLAKGTTADRVLLELAPRAGLVVYADVLARGKHYRSRPFELVADRGIQADIYVYPRALFAFQLHAKATEVSVTALGKLALTNYSWIPYAPAPEIPLPRGFTKAFLHPDDVHLASITKAGIQLARPLPPGDFHLRAGFEIPATDGVVRWSMDLPLGAFQSDFRLADEPNLSLDPPPGVKVETTTEGSYKYLSVTNISIQPKQSMAMSIQLPKLTPRQAKLAPICRSLDPDHDTALRDKPMPDFAAPEVPPTGAAGPKVKLSSLNGKLTLVNFMGTWDQLTDQERPTLAALAKRFGPGLAIVLVASDKDPKAVAAKIGVAPFRVLLDPPAGPDAPDNKIGAFTRSVGVKLLPESFLVDQKGIVRYYFANWRDWSTPEALACLQAIARE